MFTWVGTVSRYLYNGNSGIGKPEPLKHGLHGYWSRRITAEHRLIYKVVDDGVRIAQCRLLYD